MGGSEELCLIPRVFVFGHVLVFPTPHTEGQSNTKARCNLPQISAHLHRDHEVRKDTNFFKNPIISIFFLLFFPSEEQLNHNGLLGKKQQQTYLPTVHSNKPMEGSL